jgi:hypothetical protein
LQKIGEGEILSGKSKDSLKGGFTRFPQASFRRGWVLGGSQKTQQYQPQLGGLENHARSIDGYGTDGLREGREDWIRGRKERSPAGLE